MVHSCKLENIVTLKQCHQFWAQEGLAPCCQEGLRCPSGGAPPIFPTNGRWPPPPPAQCALPELTLASSLLCLPHCASHQKSRPQVARRRSLGPDTPPLPPSTCCNRHSQGASPRSHPWQSQVRQSSVEQRHLLATRPSPGGESGPPLWDPALLLLLSRRWHIAKHCDG